jgi:membrane associated rhomboid family serine protease
MEFGPRRSRYPSCPRPTELHGASAVDRLAGESDDELTGKKRPELASPFFGVPNRLSVRQSGAAMGIYDREYYRGETGGPTWFSGVTPVCKTIILINAVVFILQQSRLLSEEFVVDFLAASPEQTLRHFRVWELLTATFLHDDLWHILGNMWLFWIVGREMETLYGSRDFAAFYIASAIFSSLAWVLIIAASPHHPLVHMVGASGAVMAVMMLFTLYYPRHEIYFIVIPVPMWLLAVIYFAYPLLPLLGGGAHSSPIAIESHLAGAGFAFLFKHFDLRWSRFMTGRIFKPRLRIFSPVPREQNRTRSPSPSRSPSTGGTSGKSASVSVLPEEQLDARLDEVLAKIAREGRSGLTEEEQRVLQEASRRARIRRSDRP